MTWFLAELVKGENYPGEVCWPDGIDAFIPLSETIINQDSIAPERSAVQLFWKKSGSDYLHPLVWVNNKGIQESAIDIQGWIKVLKNESYRTEHKKPLMAKLPFHYHRIPGMIRVLVLNAMLRTRAYIDSKKGDLRRSYLDCGCEILLGVCKARWDLGVELPLIVLTHDIDSGAGFQWVAKTAGIEEKYGFRSSWNVVPKHYRVQKDVLYELLEKGHEIGLHGIWHSNIETFLSEDRIRREFSGLKNFINEFSIKGYRSPCWYRTNSMFQVLSEFFAYDLSCLDNDLIATANGGVGFMRPFRMDSGLIELPCTLLFEAPLSFKVPPEKFTEYWLPKIKFIKASNGMLLVNTHPDPYFSGNDRLLASYETLLRTIAEQNWKAKLPFEIVKEIKGENFSC